MASAHGVDRRRRPRPRCASSTSRKQDSTAAQGPGRSAPNDLACRLLWKVGREADAAQLSDSIGLGAPNGWTPRPLPPRRFLIKPALHDARRPSVRSPGSGGFHLSTRTWTPPFSECGSYSAQHDDRRLLHQVSRHRTPVVPPRIIRGSRVASLACRQAQAIVSGRWRLRARLSSRLPPVITPPSLEPASPRVPRPYSTYSFLGRLLLSRLPPRRRRHHTVASSLEHARLVCGECLRASMQPRRLAGTDRPCCWSS
jgi:hypothetical protein